MIFSLVTYGADPSLGNQNNVYPMELAREQKKAHLFPILQTAEKQCRLVKKVADWERGHLAYTGRTATEFETVT